jgi:hypothetical protein
MRILCEKCYKYPQITGLSDKLILKCRISIQNTRFSVKDTTNQNFDRLRKKTLIQLYQVEDK